MKTAVLILTWNAEKNGCWQQLLAAVAAQTLPVDRKIIIDSGSADRTCTDAAAFQWECWPIDRNDFNHGSTRDSAVRKLAAEGIDTVIFLSQDVIPAAPDSFAQLTSFLWSHPVAGCYGRQRSRKKSSFDAWQRLKCYPEQSAVKTLHESSSLGIMTPFFSDAFAAWKTAAVIQYGGFDRTDFGEDMLLAAKILNRQGAIGYCAQATAIHEHPDTPAFLFSRGWQTGMFHRRHPELLRQFRGRSAAFPHSLPCSLWLAFAIKLAGWLCGRFFS